MRFLLAVPVVLAGLSVLGSAQEQKPFKVRATDIDTPPKTSAPPPKTAGTPNATSTAKQLKNVEKQTPRGVGHAKKVPVLKPEKEPRNPPMNFGGKGGGAGTGMTKQASPYKGRLKQKGQGGHD